ncbi:MAG: hypothetical protein DHS20C18_45350 [Saprospiraceae bacterium]|nr:MAG: hypothetical protein DHS20C18_45350 [Saprospiraceae bacterium]
MITLNLDMEVTGVLFMCAAFGTIVYLPLFWLFTRKKKKATSQAWFRKEVFWLSIAIGFLGLIGTIEAYVFLAGAIKSYHNYLILTVLFAELLLFAAAFVYINFIKSSTQQYRINNRGKYLFPTQLYWLFAIGNGVALILFNDYWSEDQFFLIFVSFYFPVLFFLMVRWMLDQIRTIINLKNEKSKTELMHLQSQVNPHFFFNILNNLYGWVEKDPQKAQELILKLSDMMRYSIYDGQKDFVTLEEEILYLKNYIELHKMRYLKKIGISFNIDIQEMASKVMPLLFIILLENAFKHGVENLRENAYIKIDISNKKQEISFFIENNFDPENDRQHTGIGLKNLKRRLELVYPNRHTLLLSAKENIYKANLTINLA